MNEAPPGSPAPTRDADTAPRVTPGQLFLCFLEMGLSGFGGVLPWARRGLVEKRRWLTEQEFAETLSFGQFLPGPNVANMSIIIGTRFAGWRGALAAFCGLMLAPGVIALSAAALYGRFSDVGPLQAAIGGVSSAAAGLVIATGLKMARPLWPRADSMLFAALGFLAVGPLGLPLVPVLLVLVPSSIATAMLVERRGS
jgi:chromate transporter